MDISVVQGDISATEADVIVVNLFEGVTSPGGATGAVDRALDGAISKLIELGDIRGKAGERTTIHTLGKIAAPRVLVAGLGKAGEFDVHAVRNLSAEVARACRRPSVKTVATVVHGAGIAGLDPDACAQALAEGALLGAYQFLRYKTEADDDKAEIGRLTIVEHDGSKVAGMEAAANRGRVLAEATNLARDLANEPANNLNPTDLAGRAAEVASAPNLELEVMEEDYVRTARAKGIRESLVTLMHIFRNALIPIVTYLGLLAGSLLSGQVFVENVFGRPGLGRFLVDSISARDYPQIRGGILFVAAGYVFVNLIVDLLYGVIDPRITYE